MKNMNDPQGRPGKAWGRKGEKIIVGRAEWEYAGRPNPDDTFMPWLIREQLQKQDLEIIDGEGELEPGINFISVPGHTPGCNALLLHIGTEKVVLTFDVIKTYLELITARSMMPFGSPEDDPKGITIFYLRSHLYYLIVIEVLNHSSYNGSVHKFIYITGSCHIRTGHQGKGLS